MFRTWIVVQCSVYAILTTAILLFRASPSSDAIQWFGTYEFMLQGLFEGTLPLWNTYAQGGSPYFPYLGAMGRLDPTALIAAPFRFWLDPMQTYTVYYLLRMAVFVCGVSGIVLQQTRNRNLAIASVFATWCGVVLVSMHQDGGLNTFQWVPLATYFWLRWSESQGERVLFFAASMVCFGLQGAMFIPVGPLIYAIVFFGATLKHCWPAWKRSFLSWQSSTQMVFSFLIGICVAAPAVGLFLNSEELFPILRVKLNGGHFAKVFASDVSTDLLGVDLKQASFFTSIHDVHTFLFGSGRPLGSYSEYILFVSTAAMALAMYAAVKARSYWVRLWTGIGVLFLCLSGIYAGNVRIKPPWIQWLEGQVHILNAVEVYENYAFILIMVVPVLAALGWQECRKNKHEHIVLSGVLGVFLIRAIGPLRIWPTYAWALLAFGLFVSIFRLWPSIRIRVAKKFPKWMATLFLIDLIVTLSSFQFGGLYTHIARGFKDAVGHFQNENVGSASFRQSTLYKDSVWSAMGGDNALWGFWHLESVLNRRVLYSVQFLDSVGSSGHRPIFDGFFSTRSFYDFALNVSPERHSWIAEKHWARVYPIESIKTFNTPKDVATFLDQAKESEFCSTLALQTAGSEEVPRLVSAKVFLKQPEKRPAFSKQSDLTQCFSESMQLPAVSYTWNHLEAVLEKNAEPSVLYVAEGYSRYWKAFVDGVESPIERANLGFMAVRLPPDTRKVLFRFLPEAYVWSLWIYFSALFGFLLVAVARACPHKKIWSRFQKGFGNIEERRR